MTPIWPGYDWGRRSPRWAGITSEVVDIGGTRVHFVRAGAESAGPTHLLIHPMGAGAWCWMDVIRPLSAKGQVIALDLPGAGRSRPLRRAGNDSFAVARSIVAPTSLLWGNDDRVIPERLIHEVEVAHPSWSSRIIDGIGHLMPWEAPESYVELAG